MNDFHRNSDVIIIDGQIFQTEAWNRGMGKYMLQLMKQLSEINLLANVRLKVLFNSKIKTDSTRFETINYLCPNFEQLHTELPLPGDEGINEASRYKYALDKYLGAHYGHSSIAYILTTLFSFDIFSEYPTIASKKAMVFYDLIPLLKWSDLGGYFPPNLYMGRFQRIYESDIIFCISETTRNDVLETFNIDPLKTFNINGGFTEHHLDAIKPVSFKVPKKYVLFPTGNLPHKNNELVFEAFRETLEIEKDLYLVVTSTFSDAVKRRLERINKKNVIFTQNVSDEELQYLYKHASVVLFASKYEGLGLPVLDAVFHGKPVVASSIAVFREMSKHAFFYFDVNSPDSAKKAIIEALSAIDFGKKKKEYPKILEKYDWTKVGDQVASELVKINPVSSKDNEIGIVKQKIAIISLNPGIRPGFTRMAEPLFARISGKYDMSYFFDGCGMSHEAMERPTYLDYLDVPVFDIDRLTVSEYRKFDHIFYVIDTESLNHKMARVIAALPGNLIVDSTMDGNDVMYRAISKRAQSKLSVKYNGRHSLDEIDSRISAITRGDYLEQGEAAKLMRSHLPNYIKKARLKEGDLR